MKMRTRTYVSSSFIVNVLLFTLLICLSRPNYGEVYWHSKNSLLHNGSTGTIRDILITEQGLWVGSENGLYLRQGGKTKEIEIPEFESGYISNLQRGVDGNVVVVIYNSGIYFVDTSYRIKELDVGVSLKKAWDIKESKRYWVITTIGSILFVDKKSNKIVKRVEGFKDRAFSSIPVVSTIDDDVFIFQGDKFLILDSKLSVKEKLIEEFWPNLTEVLYFRKIDGEYLIVGGSGIYSGREIFSQPNFKPVYSDTVKIRNVSQVESYSGHIFIFSDNIYEVSESEVVIPRWTRSLWHKNGLGQITGAQVSNNGRLLLSTSLKGLIYIPSFYKSISIFDKRPPRERLKNTNLFDSKQLNVKDDSIIDSFCKSSTNDEELRIPCNNETKYILPYLDSFLAFVYSGEKSDHIFIFDGDGRLIDRIYPPTKISTLTINDEGVISYISPTSSFYTQITKVSWNHIEIAQLKDVRVTCVLDIGNQFYRICSTTKGIWTLDAGKRNIYKNNVDALGSKFIRGGAIDGYGSIWIASNIGLSIYENKAKKWFHISSTDGIRDTDFEYNALSLYDEDLYVRGDNANYIIDTEEFHRILDERVSNVTKAHVEVTSEEIDHYFTGKHNIRFSSESEVEIHAFLNDYFAEHNLKLEYSISSEADNWIRVAEPDINVTLSELNTGSHIFKVRAVDPRSNVIQPVSELIMHITPPWWRSPTALATYAGLILLAVIAFHRCFQRRLTEQGEKLSGIVNEKQTALENSNQAIRRILERKQTLFTNLSHELRTPLSLVLGPLSQVESDPESKENASRIDVAKRNAERMRVLVDQLLEIERLETVKDLPKQQYAVHDDLPRLLKNLLPLAEMKQQNLTWKCKGAIEIALITDSLEKIVTNLVSNAVKYTPQEGTITVEVREDELHLEIVVTDNGRGMDAKEQESIFSRYTRLEKTDNTGIGVGLALVKELVTANRGWIVVESTPFEGSRFTVRLPMLVAEQSPTSAVQSVSSVSEIKAEYESSPLPDNEQGKPVILIVDDNEEMRQYLKDLLSTHYTCLCAGDGNQALSLVKHSSPALVLTDYMMPGMDGLQLSKAVRSNEATSHIPIIMLTARGDGASVRAGLAAYVDSYLTKPVNTEELTLRVRNLIALQQRIWCKLPAPNESKDDESETTVPDFVSERDQHFYFKLVGLLEQHYADEGCNREFVANQLAVSDRHLARKMRALFNESFSDYLREFRLSRSREMLIEGKQITQVVFDVGFNSPAYFSRCFKSRYGVSPSEFQNAHRKKRKA